MVNPIVKLPLYGQLKEHVSYSELNLFKSCQWKWALIHIFKIIPDDPGSLALVFGKAVHSGMEILYSDEGSIEKATEHTIIQLSKDSEILELSESEKIELERLKILVHSIFRDALLCPELQDIRPLKSELGLYEKINRNDGLDISFKGFIDIIFIKKLKRKTVIYIADFKTCTWGWPSKKLMDPQVCAQILLYKHFFVKLTGADPKNVTVAFILLKKNPQKNELSVEVAKIGGGPKAIAAAIEYLQSSITMMHGYNYEQNLDSCKRSWIDKETKEEKFVFCPFYKTENCMSSTQ